MGDVFPDIRIGYTLVGHGVTVIVTKKWTNIVTIYFPDNIAHPSQKELCTKFFYRPPLMQQSQKNALSCTNSYCALMRGGRGFALIVLLRQGVKIMKHSDVGGSISRRRFLSATAAVGAGACIGSTLCAPFIRTARGERLRCKKSPR